MVASLGGTPQVAPERAREAARTPAGHPSTADAGARTKEPARGRAVKAALKEAAAERKLGRRNTAALGWGREAASSVE